LNRIDGMIAAALRRYSVSGMILDEVKFAQIGSRIGSAAPQTTGDARSRLCPLLKAP
jgi:hypothetical protein